jgi:hypothetical protein
MYFHFLKKENQVCKNSPKKSKHCVKLVITKIDMFLTMCGSSCETLCETLKNCAGYYDPNFDCFILVG